MRRRRLKRAIDPLVCAVLRAIRERRGLDVLYQSMSRPKPLRRTIEPHALAHDGFRWHARSFDRERGEFRDFVLGRVLRAKVAGLAQSKPGEDADWTSFVPLVIAPHPGLTPAQARAIAIDYGLRAGRAGLKPAPANGTRPTATIQVRRALLFYALRRFGLDAAGAARPPSERHIVLVNRTEVSGAMRPREEA
jgi:hypothetical protein